MEKHFEFTKKLMQVHKPGRMNPDKCIDADCIVFTEEWKIACKADCGVVLKEALLDLQDYFKVSMGIDLAIVSLEESTEKTIFVSVDSSLESRNFRIKTSERVEIFGSDERRAAQGCYVLEDEMNLNEYPAIKPCDITRRMRFSPRFIHSGMPARQFPKEHLRQIAHFGFDAIMLMADPKITEGGEACVKFNEIIRQAAVCGLDVYTFCPFKNPYHPDDEGAYEFYESTYGALARLCPDLKGLILIGESCEFPSKDTRTTGKPWQESLKDDKPSPGWFPCSDYPQFASMIQKIIHAHSENIELVFWTYNWFYEDEELRSEFVRNLPEGITAMATFEMQSGLQISSDAKEVTTDYTLWQIGPGSSYGSEAKVAREVGRKMIAMTNSAGNTWDIGGVPYLPAPQRWMKRWEAVINCQETLKLDGTQDSWSYGFWPSFICEMAKYAYMEPSPDMNELLQRLIVRDYGKENLEKMLEIFSLFSEGMTHCVSTNEDQFGPARVGPSYPLFFKRWELIPKGPQSCIDVNFEAFPVYTYNLDYTDRLIYETKEFRLVADIFDEGCRRLTEIMANLPAEKIVNARELLGVSKFIANTARTIHHVKRWHYLKGQLGVYVDAEPTWVGGRKGMEDAKKAVKSLVPASNPKPVVRELIDILKREIVNAEDTISLVEENSRLGYEQEFDYACSKEQLEWKIEMARRTLNEELLPLL